MDKKFFMFERSEFEKFPISSAFYSTRGGGLLRAFLPSEKRKKLDIVFFFATFYLMKQRRLYEKQASIYAH